MKTLAEIREDKRILPDPKIPILFDEKTGRFFINAWARVQKNKSGKWASVVASNDENGMEHASVAFKDRCPTWEEMCIVKDIFWREDGNNEHVIDKGKCFGSLIHFDTRQVWECYFVGYCNPEWNCERSNLVLRMSPNDFKRIFGEIKIVNHEPERLALIRQGRTDVGIALI